MLGAFATCLLLISCLANEDREYREAAPIEAAGDWELVFAQQLWRHGDRSPITQYQIPGDPYKPEDWKKGGGGYGQLTPIGMKQHMTLGLKLRDRYKNFVSPRYVSNEVFVRSTDVNRTLISAISNMIGFYSTVNATAGEDYPNDAGWPGSGGGLNGAKGVPFIPVPIHTVPERWDPVLGVHNCPRERYVFDKLRKTPEWNKTIQENKDLLKTVEKLGGFVNFTLERIIGVRDTLFIEKSAAVPTNYSMPPGFDNDLFDQIDKLAGVVDDFEDGINVNPMDGINFRIDIPKLTGGPLLWEMIGHMELKKFCLDKQNGRNATEQAMCAYFDTLKYYAFSAHDSTISNLFSTFGFKESNFNQTGLPHYASCVSIELYRSPDGKNYNVTVLYWPELHGPYDVTHWVDGCTRECTLEEFKNRSKPYQITDMESFCKLDSGAFALNLTATSLLVAFMAMLVDWTSNRA